MEDRCNPFELMNHDKRGLLSKINLSVILSEYNCIEYFDEHYRKIVDKLSTNQLIPNYEYGASHIYIVILGENRDISFFIDYLTVKKIDYYISTEHQGSLLVRINVNL
jgi:hypothetical protein